MICPKCDYDMGDSLMCPKCGFGANEYADTIKKNEQENTVESPPYNLYLIFSIILLMICQIPGILALVFTVLMNTNFNSGNYEESVKYRKYAKIFLSVGYAITVFIILICIFVIMAIWPHTVF
jgi:ABC-type spermidine/putrescine transport system permease subunit I